MIGGDCLYVENVTGDGNQFIVFGAGNMTWSRYLVLTRWPLCDRIMTMCMKVEAYLLAYMDSINIVPLESEWCVPEELFNVKILPPLVDTKLGRKRRKCVKGVSENFKSKIRN
ncbi:hypothetical protein KY289_025010 [Solanum tuberosum]|nr:hypothetical protein KY289_025010 [Solanum tuberosum]KAH0673661.1 hypothetical protein KY284_024748 [Solanum tuberosum]KAH0709857.1 hypothetical protein KY284_011284 [Solanum tuberosum]